MHRPSVGLLQHLGLLALAALLALSPLAVDAGSARSLASEGAGVVRPAAVTSPASASAKDPLLHPGLAALTQRQLAYAHKLCARLFSRAGDGGSQRKDLRPEHVTLYNDSGEVSCRDVLDAVPVTTPAW